MKIANCVQANDDVVIEEEDITETDIDELQETGAAGFNVIFEEDGATHKKKEKKYTGIAKKPDYEKIQKAKNKTGALGEEIVMDILTREAEEAGLKSPFHASKEEGDGLGYDIRYWDKDGKEIHVEVKASKDIMQMALKCLITSWSHHWIQIISTLYIEYMALTQKQKNAK